jgi:hypothetical protein
LFLHRGGYPDPRGVHIVDPTLDLDFANALRRFGTTLAVPMLRDRSTLGAITVTRNQVEASPAHRSSC